MSETGTGGGGKAPLAIEDLRVMTGYLSEWVEDQTRPATPADLIEVLKGLGAFRRTILVQEGNDLDRPGSYIVWRIEEE